MPHVTVDWLYISDIMIKSIEGSELTDTEMGLCRRAFKADPDRYRELHAAAKETAVCRLTAWWEK